MRESWRVNQGAHIGAPQGVHDARQNLLPEPNFIYFRSSLSGNVQVTLDAASTTAPSPIANPKSQIECPAFSRIFPPFPAYFRIKKILRRWVLSLPSRRAHGLRIQKPPYSSLFQAIPGYSSLLRHRVEGGGLWSIARFKRNRKLLLPSHSQNLHNVKQNASLTGINRDKPALSGIKPKLFFSPKWRAVCFYFA